MVNSGCRTWVCARMSYVVPLLELQPVGQSLFPIRLPQSQTSKKHLLNSFATSFTRPQPDNLLEWLNKNFTATDHAAVVCFSSIKNCIACRINKLIVDSDFQSGIRYQIWDHYLTPVDLFCFTSSVTGYMAYSDSRNARFNQGFPDLVQLIFSYYRDD